MMTQFHYVFLAVRILGMSELGMKRGKVAEGKLFGKVCACGREHWTPEGL